MPEHIPLEDEELIRTDLMAAEERGPDIAQAEIEALNGNPLEADLIRSGHYGEQGQGLQEGDPRLAVMFFGQLLSEIRRNAIDERWAQDENTLLNFAFKNGHHYVEVDNARRAVVPLPQPKNLIRRTVDKFQPWYRAQHGRLAAGMPQSAVIPKTSRQEDKDAASFAEQLREWVAPMAFNHQNRSVLAMWKLLGGIGVIYNGVEWAYDEEYYEATGGQMLHRPDLVFRVHSPLECWCDNTQPSIKDMRWFGVDQFVPVAEARGMYLNPEHQRRIVPEQDNPQERGYYTLREAQRMLGRQNPWEPRLSGSQSAHRVDEEDDTVLAEWWCVPGTTMEAAHLDGLQFLESVTVEVLSQGTANGNAALVRFPRGLRVVFTVDGFILDMTDNPHGKIPFRESKGSQSAGFWTPAWATPMREINQAINWLISMREQHLIRTANPPFLEPREARVHRRQTASGVQQRIRYRANRFGMEPKFASVPNMAADSVGLLQELNRLFEDLAGLHEVSQARLPTRLSGVAVALLQEQDLAQLGFTGQEIEDAFGEVLKDALVNVQKFFPETDPRLLSLSGDAPYQLEAFMMSDLENDLSLQVKPGSAVPQSPAAIKAEARELWELGILVDDFGRPDHRKVLEAYGYGSRDELYQEEELDKQNARNEEELILQLPPEMAQQLLVEAMETGDLMEPLGISSYDNDLVHERSHRRRLKAIEDDARIHFVNKKLLEYHWIQHIQAAMPILMQTDPDVVMPFLAEAEGEGEGEPNEGSGD